jgi:uncharacterized membrane protein
MPAGVLALIVALAMLLLLPFLLADAMVSALLGLGIAPRVATLLVIGIFVGSLFNVPVWRRAGAAVLEYRPSDFFGLGRLAPRLVQPGAPQVIALNVGGCLIPSLIVVYELARLLDAGGGAPLHAAVAIALNVAGLLPDGATGRGTRHPAARAGAGLSRRAGRDAAGGRARGAGRFLRRRAGGR